MTAGRPTFQELARRAAALEAELDEVRRERDALRESRNFYQDLVETSNDLLYAADADGTLTYCSPQVSRYGYTPDEIVGHSLLEFVHPDDVDRVTAEFRLTMTSGREFPTRFRLVAKDGRVVHVEDFGRVRRENGRIVGLSGLLRDVTERTDAEAALRRQEEQYRSLVENLNIGVYRNTGGPHGRFLQANPAIARMFGYDSVEEFMQIRTSDLYQDPEDRRRFVEEALRRGVVKDRELRLKKKDGTPIWASCTARIQYDENGDIAWFDGVIEDITDRKRAEEALRESERRYRTLFEGATEGIAAVDQETRRFVFANPALCRMFGYTEKEFQTKTVADVHPPDALEHVLSEFEAQATGRKVLAAEIPCLRKDGTVFLADIAATPAVLDGRLCNVGFFHDVTVRVQAEQEIQKLNRDLERRVAERTQDLESANRALRREIAERQWAERALRESEARYRAIYEAIPDAVALYDPTSGRITHANDAFFQLYGYAPEQLDQVTRRPFWAVHPDDRDRIRRLAAELDRRPGPRRFPEHREVRADGSVFWAEYVTTDIELGGGPLRLAIIRDVTDRVQAQAALRESEERYRTLAESAREDIFVLRPDLTVEYANSFAARHVRRTPGSVVGRPIRDLFSPGAYRELEKNVRAVFETGQPMSVEEPVRFAHAPDREVWLSTQLTPLRDADGAVRGVMGISRDVTRRKQAEQALRESEARYRGLFDASPEVIFVLSPEDGTFTALNPAFRSITGWPRDEWIGRRFQEILHPDDVPLAEEKFARSIRGEVLAPFELRIRTRDGAHVVGQVVTTVLVERGRITGVLGYVRDVTEARRAADALRESEARYRLLVETMNEGIAVMNDAGLVTFVNGAFCRMLGYDGPDEVLGRPVMSFHDEANRRILQAQLERRRAGEKAQYELDFLRKDGGKVHALVSPCPLFDPGGRFRGSFATVTDITDRRRAEEALRESEERYRTIFQALPDPMFLYDPETGVIASANDAMLETFGYPREDIQAGRLGVFDLVPEEYHDRMREEMREALGLPGPVHRGIHPTRTKSGDTVYLDAVTAPIRVSRRNLRLVVARDVTRQIELQQRLIRSERMAAVGTLALSVAHEIHNLLGGLRGLAELAEGNPDLVPRLIRTCRAVAERGGTIADRMATLSRADEPGEERRIDVADVARGVVQMMTPSLAPRGITIEETCGEVPPTWINEGRVLQVLLNLVANARDSIGRDGTIRVSVEHDPEPNHIVVRVQDTGAGIRPEDLPRVFDPFFTTKRESGPDGAEPTHLGLGLPESLAIVRESGGTIDVESRPGQGATFTVRLPVRSAPTARRSVPADDALPEKGTRMLVVDDDELVRFVIAERLRGLGYEVVAATSGKEAVALCDRESFTYVFVDMLMPGEVDGVTACRRISKQLPEAKIIISTAYGEEDIPRDCLGRAFAFLKKPFGEDDLARALVGRKDEAR